MNHEPISDDRCCTLTKTRNTSKSKLAKCSTDDVQSRARIVSSNVAAINTLSHRNLWECTPCMCWDVSMRLSLCLCLCGLGSMLRASSGAAPAHEGAMQEHARACGRICVQDSLHTRAGAHPGAD